MPGKGFRKISAAIALAGMLMLFTGCPDKSHLRPVPDYSKQKDPHGGEGQVEKDESPQAPADKDDRGE